MITPEIRTMMENKFTEQEMKLLASTLVHQPESIISRLVELVAETHTEGYNLGWEDGYYECGESGE